MGTQNRSQSDTGEYFHALIRLVRITTRWQFDATTISEARTKTRRWANKARGRGGDEIWEFSEDAKQQFESAKPEIRAWVHKVRNLTELIALKLSNAFHYRTKGAVLIFVMLGVIWLSGSLWNEVPTSDQAVQIEKHQGGSGLVIEPDDEEWGDGFGRTPNDDRSDSLNPNNDAYQASMDNRSDQMNPNNDAYQSSRR